MLKNDQLRNRLELLFGQEDNDDGVFVSNENLAPAGWSWECDGKGTLIYCSGEIEQILGYTVEEAIGQSIAEFALDQGTSNELKRAVELKDFGNGVDVDFITVDGNPINGRLNLLNNQFENNISKINEISERFRGFTQIVNPQSNNAYLILRPIFRIEIFKQLANYLKIAQNRNQHPKN